MLRHYTNIHAADIAATIQAAEAILAHAMAGNYIGLGWFSITPRRRVEFGRAGYARRDSPVALQGAIYLASGLIRSEGA